MQAKGSKQRVLILGVGGMLGSAVFQELKLKYSLMLTARDAGSIDRLEKVYGGTSRHSYIHFDVERIYDCYVERIGHECAYLEEFLEKVGDVDRVINAVGVTIPYSRTIPALTFFINSVFPHILARKFGDRLIHITTDCVFNGKSGFPYSEESAHCPIDLYGLSKNLGEPQNCLTIRTSIIGRELMGLAGLLEWFLEQKGQEIVGFAEHYWNGITTKQFGVICDKLISDPDRYPRSGLYHVFSTVLTKYEMLLKFREKYNVSCNIKKDQTRFCNRTLKTVRELNSQLEVPSFDEMLSAL